ncbi:MFS transporter [Nocardioides gansuensis]|uniref:MFS transporter n=1 Tax=Nocardioides gansuensis TaxID=2138300 RepID=A0A2T8F7R9_9ACTN|nr:MFS transporter [Nocardioides gansuensis]
MPERPARRTGNPDCPRVVFGVLVVGVTSYTLLQSMTVPALPLIQAELGTSQAAASWVLTAFLVSASVATPIVGRLGDAYGKTRMFVVSLALLGVGALGAALATDVRALVAARVVQGLAGGVLPLAFGIIREQLPVRRVPGAVALLSSLMSVGFGAGIVVSGPVVHILGYRPLFLLPMATALLAAFAAHLLVPESRARTGQPVRLLSAVALAGWLVCGLLAISWAPTVGWTSLRTVAFMTAATLLLVAWVLVETHVDVPLIHLDLLLDRRVLGANVVALLVGVSMYASFGYLPQLVQTPESSGYGLGASVAASGYLMLPTAVLSFVAGVLSPRLGRRLGARALITSGCWLSATGLGVTAVAHDHAWQIMLANALTGLGSGTSFAVLANVVVAAAPEGRVGVATGLNANLRTIGGAIGSAVLASVLAQHLLPSGYPEEAGYVVAFALLAVASTVAGIVAFTITERCPQSPSAMSRARVPWPARPGARGGRARPPEVVPLRGAGPPS